MRKITLLLLICCVFMSGCAASTKQLRKINLDMTKKEVLKNLGEPNVVRGSMRNKYDQVIEVWEYRFDKGKESNQVTREWLFTACTFGFGSPILLSQGTIDSYWLYFHDDALVQWGQAGDWKREADRIYEINFSAGSKL